MKIYQKVEPTLVGENLLKHCLQLQLLRQAGQALTNSSSDTPGYLQDT